MTCEKGGRTCAEEQDDDHNHFTEPSCQSAIKFMNSEEHQMENGEKTKEKR